MSNLPPPSSSQSMSPSVKSKKPWHVSAFWAIIFSSVLVSCTGGGYNGNENKYKLEPAPYKEPVDYPEVEPYEYKFDPAPLEELLGYLEEQPDNGYSYDYDLDCEDIGEEVWVGDYDPNYLDADGDGLGCESFSYEEPMDDDYSEEEVDD
jgi:hypothetical protein